MLENPFKPITPESDTDPKQNAKLVAAILGTEAAKKYAELDAGREGKNGDDQSDLKLTDTEKAVVQEAREKEIWDRAHYIRWAESFGKDEKWVDEKFTFHDDGTVGCSRLDLSVVTELREFPSNLKIRIFLFLHSLTSLRGVITLENFELDGALYINRTLKDFADKLKSEGKIKGEVVIVQ